MTPAATRIEAARVRLRLARTLREREFAAAALDAALRAWEREQAITIPQQPPPWRLPCA